MNSPELALGHVWVVRIDLHHRTYGAHLTLHPEPWDVPNGFKRVGGDLNDRRHLRLMNPQKSAVMLVVSVGDQVQWINQWISHPRPQIRVLGLPDQLRDITAHEPTLEHSGEFDLPATISDPEVALSSFLLARRHVGEARGPDLALYQLSVAEGSLGLNWPTILIHQPLPGVRISRVSATVGLFYYPGRWNRWLQDALT